MTILDLIVLYLMVIYAARFGAWLALCTNIKIWEALLIAFTIKIIHLSYFT